MCVVHHSRITHPSSVTVSTPSDIAPEWEGVSKGLSPDMILQYVQLRLANIDNQLKDFTNEVNDRKKRQDDLRAFEAAVRELNSGPSGYDTTGFGEDSAVDSKKYDSKQSELNALSCEKLDNAKKQLSSASPDLAKKLDGLKTDIMEANDDGSKISSEKLNTLLDDAKDELSKLNSDNEMTMMRLSSLMQQRTQVVQFSSNVMSSLNDAAKSVLQNMRG
jgi:hypothetical protein